MWALKYRPKNFKEVVGQKEAIDVLLSSKDKSSTFILHGESGVGKTTLARIYANEIDGEVIEINGADTNGVDDVRALISSATYVSAFNTYRVFILDECHMLTTQAWNALLKILEESPKSTVWMLCTTEYNKVPQTIKSRSTSLKLNNINKQDMTQHLHHILAHENEVVEEEIIDRIVMSSNGRLREAIVALETYVNSNVLDLPLSTYDIIKLFTNAFSGNTMEVIEVIDTIRHSDIEAIVNFVNDYMKLLLIRKAVLPSELTTEAILEAHTDISPSLLNDMRELQESIWRASKEGTNEWKNTFNFVYEVYDTLMSHYNDFRDAKQSVRIALLKILGDAHE